METGFEIPDFVDSPSREKLESSFASWSLPLLPEDFRGLAAGRDGNNVLTLCSLFNSTEKLTEGVSRQKTLEFLIVDWLYTLIRANIKRGRYFELDQVLKCQLADCLGYVKVFTLLGRLCGLPTGAVEVTIDNRGRRAPHTAALVILPDGARRFIDFWYGSTNIRHRKLGLSVETDNGWKVADVALKDLGTYSGVSYLPDYCVDALTFYVRGNRFLKNGQFREAIEEYSRAIELYPLNSRVFYNRAIACESLGEQDKARKDYARALIDEAAVERTSATQAEEVETLINLDSAGLSERDQHVYLLHTGFVTGRRTSPPALARKLRLSVKKVLTILATAGAVLSRSDKSACR
jgi:tetratricopeptide (TPR) repeat protein